MIPSFMLGGAVTGGLVMAFGSGQLAPHGGIWVIALISKPLLFLLALVVGTVVSALAVMAMKGLGHGSDAEVADEPSARPVVAHAA